MQPAKKRKTGTSSSSWQAPSHPIVLPKGKTPVKEQAPVKAKALAKEGIRDEKQPPSIPANAAPVNRENCLNAIPTSNRQKRWNRPWYLFDFVDPAPKFRHLEDEFDSLREKDDVSEGDYSEDLTDNPSTDTKPVSVYGYLQRYNIKALGDLKDETALFDYDNEQLCKIAIHVIIFNTRAKRDEKQIMASADDCSSRIRVSRIHRGYRRVVAGLVREIEFVSMDGITDKITLARAAYLVKILDRFGDELLEFTKAPGPRWRSRVLNPLLQRQLRGLTDDRMEDVERAVGSSVEDAVRFYLVEDPLDPKNTLRMMHDILYIWPVRHSLACLNRGGSQHTLDGILTNTLYLMKNYENAEEWEAGSLYDYELKVIRREEITNQYKKLIENTAEPEHPME